MCENCIAAHCAVNWQTGGLTVDKTLYLPTEVRGIKWYKVGVESGLVYVSLQN